MMAGDVHLEPAHNDRHGRVRAGGDQEQRPVLQAPIVVNYKQDREASDGNACGNEHEQEAVLGFVGKVGDEERESESRGPGRD